MIEVVTKNGQKLVAEKLHIDTIGESSMFMWFFDRLGNCKKENKGTNSIREIPESITINGVKFVKA